ncbi:aldo/keto reductase [Sulfolobus sp. B1]|uniref:aldo/keto reductase n=1 Tax=Sulfolobus sp. B1 TaxID=2200888 RepID=UPI0011810D03|nr:aldo/keto reductase [Sulfolobus sp. B1]TRM97344.1 aldo/keto reductase [Sulfolobus sp. B1]
MKYVRLGDSGLKVSQICLGTWFLPLLSEKDELGVYKVDEETTLKILKKAYDEGVNFIDTANVYHGALWETDPLHVGLSEKLVGKFLSSVDRESVLISTKVRGKMANWANGEGLSRKHITWQIRESLRRLNTEYVDIYIIHWTDHETPKIETLRTLNDLVRRGLVYYLGVSNHEAHDIIEFLELSERYNLEKFSVIQDLYNLLERQVERYKLSIARRFGLAIMAYAPLAHGFLTGKYVDFNNKTWKVDELTRISLNERLKTRYFRDSHLKVLLTLKEIADEKDATISQISIAWLLKRGEEFNVPIIPVIGVTRLEHLDDNLNAIKIKLSYDDMKKIDEALGNA